MYPRLETVSEMQRDLSNRLLLLAASEAASEPGIAEDTRAYRLLQTRDLRAALLGHSSRVRGLRLEEIVSLWWHEERGWMRSLPESQRCHADEYVLYRLFVLFARNQSLCPFMTTRAALATRRPRVVADSACFDRALSKHFRAFCRLSADLPGDAHSVHAELGAMQRLDVVDAVGSARHRLVGTGSAVSVELAGGPMAALMPAAGRGVVMAAYFGHLMGFAGAAATTRGLVLLEGGEVSSSGFSLCHGEPSFGILCGEPAAAPRGIDPDLLQLCRALKDLPILLAAGRLLKELGGEHLHRAINQWLRQRSHADCALGDDGERSARPTEATEEPAVEERSLQRLYVRARRSSRVYAWTTLHDLRAGLRAFLRPTKGPA